MVEADTVGKWSVSGANVDDSSVIREAGVAHGDSMAKVVWV